jgi:hypothetical protein
MRSKGKKLRSGKSRPSVVTRGFSPYMRRRRPRRKGGNGIARVTFFVIVLTVISIFEDIPSSISFAYAGTKRGIQYTHLLLQLLRRGFLNLLLVGYNWCTDSLFPTVAGVASETVAIARSLLKVTPFYWLIKGVWHSIEHAPEVARDFLRLTRGKRERIENECLLTILKMVDYPRLLLGDIILAGIWLLLLLLALTLYDPNIGD